jgi:SlyX protein
MSSTEQPQSNQELSGRIDTLEMRLTFQDDTIETLNQTITAQWREIDALKRQITRLLDRIEDAQTNAEGPRNEPPPHY